MTRCSVRDADPSIANGWQVVHDTPTGTRLYWIEDKNEFTTDQEKGTVFEATAPNAYITAELIADEKTEDGYPAFVLPVTKIDPRAVFHDTPLLNNVPSKPLCMCVCPVHGNKIVVESLPNVHQPRYTSNDPIWRCSKCGIILESDESGSIIIGTVGECNGSRNNDKEG